MRDKIIEFISTREANLIIGLGIIVLILIAAYRWNLN